MFKSVDPTINLLHIYILYFGVLNILGFLFMTSDKYKAMKNKWRIPERTLFAFAIFGGSLGVLSAMVWMNHKTQKKAFKYGIPIIMVITYSIAVYLLLNANKW